MIWALTFINIRGLREAGLAQIAMTVLKIAPLLAVAAFGLLAGDPSNAPPFNPKNEPLVSAVAAAALLTLWAFTGFEAGTVPASAVANPARTIPRALTLGMLTVAAIYLLSSFAVMRLVPPVTLAVSAAPFVEAARGMGAAGPLLVGAGALVATAGALNGIIFICGQMPMAVARDGLAPAFFAGVNRGGAPTQALLVSAAIGSILLFANYSRGALEAFTFLVTMATVAALVVYFVCALAFVKRALSPPTPSVLLGALGAAYALFAIFGSGAEAMFWGAVLSLIGAALYFALSRGRKGVNAEVR